MTVPDYISPVVGYRVWQWDAAGLKSLNGEPWVASTHLSASCKSGSRGFISGLSNFSHDSDQTPHPSCTCGVYAAKTLERVRQGYSRFGLYGEVLLWGTIVEHERGWRAQYAYPKSFVLAPHALPFSMSMIDARLETLIAFGTDIFIIRDDERVPLWKRGAGFDAAGLDHLIKTRKEYYVRRQQGRTLKKDDRVALLGHGIAVVKQIDGKEVYVALGNSFVLRIARKEIVVNEQNNRWECVANKARGYQVCE